MLLMFHKGRLSSAIHYFERGEKLGESKLLPDLPDAVFMLRDVACGKVGVL